MKTDLLGLGSEYEYDDGAPYDTVEVKDEEPFDTDQRTNITTGEFITGESKFIYAEPQTESNPKKKNLEMAVFKLADEAQMGGLNSLMMDTYEGKINQNGKIVCYWTTM